MRATGNSPIRGRHGWAAWVCFAFFAFAGTGFAEVRVSLPLEGHYRPGRYMPVIVYSSDTSDVTLSAEGAIPTVVEGPTPSGGRIVPILMLSSAANEIRWSTGAAAGTAPTPLRALTARERLVGVERADMLAPGALFGSAVVLKIVLPDEPLSGAPAVWEALDAALLERDTLGRLAWVRDLSAGGTILGYRLNGSVEGSGDAAADRAGWEAMDGWSILRPGIAGPATAGYSEAAYRPTWGWEPGRPEAYRHRVLLAAGVFVLLSCAALLPARPRARIAALGILVVLSLIVVFIWRRSGPSLAEARGEVIVRSGDAWQEDRWLYQQAIEPTDWMLRWDGMTRPVLLGRRHHETIGLTLWSDRDGGLSYRYHLPPGGVMAFMSRRWREAPPSSPPPLLPSVSSTEPTVVPVGQSRLRDLVQQLYLGRGDWIEGMIDDDASWGTIVVRRGGG